MNPSLIFQVRDLLGDVPEEYLSDENILTALEMAETYLNEILPDDVDTDYKEKCQYALAAYYAYLSYTSTIERGMGSIPATSEFKLQQLKELALSLIRIKVNVNDDLSLAVDGGKPIAVGLTWSMTNYDC